MQESCYRDAFSQKLNCYSGGGWRSPFEEVDVADLQLEMHHSATSLQ